MTADRSPASTADADTDANSVTAHDRRAAIHALARDGLDSMAEILAAEYSPANTDDDANEKALRRELGDDSARAVGVEDDRIAIRDVTEIDREQEDNPTVTVLRIKREIPDPRDGSRTTTTEHATRCVVAGGEHVGIAAPRNLWGRMRQHARAEHDTQTRTGGQA
jgi:hypothetical protein